MNNYEQIEEYEISFYTYISEEEDNKELRYNEVKGKENVSFVILFCRETISVFNYSTILQLSSYDIGYFLTSS